MGELLDREYQRIILQSLANHYPQSPEIFQLFGHQVDNGLLVNLCYLAEHGLVENLRADDDGGVDIVSARITARGLDFLQDDGGLTAILGVVTVKLDDATIRDLIVQKVEDNEPDPTIRQRIIHAIRDIPAEAMKSVTMRALDIGLSNGPNLVAALKVYFNI